MRLTLYDNPFSPFARKVRLVMEHKGLEFETVDGLLLGERDRLSAANARVEVPVLDHGGLIVVNSADIIAYLDRVFPDVLVYPGEPAGYVHARAWERCSDTAVDSILVNLSYWTWAIRDDELPEGLLEAGRRDMNLVYAALNCALEGHEWVCGDLSVADMALFPQLSGARMLGVPIDGTAHPNTLAWYKRCRSKPLFQADLSRVKNYLSNPQDLDIEREKIFWRGDRIEWMLAQGQQEWFVNEIESGRVIWPGLGVPGLPVSPHSRTESQSQLKT